MKYKEDCLSINKFITNLLSYVLSMHFEFLLRKEKKARKYNVMCIVQYDSINVCLVRDSSPE